MSERVFKKPEGSETTSGGIKFVKARELNLEIEEGIREAGAPVLEGTFVDSTPNQFNANKLDYKFETESGDTLILNGAGNLGYKMKFVNVGDYVQITYSGMQEATGGNYKGTLMHQFDVLTSED